MADIEKPLPISTVFLSDAAEDANFFATYPSRHGVPSVRHPQNKRITAAVESSCSLRLRCGRRVPLDRTRLLECSPSAM